MLEDLSIKAAGADGMYHPPDWDPRKISRDKFQGSRGANQFEMFGKIRFETPWNMYCTTCENHIAQACK